MLSGGEREKMRRGQRHISNSAPISHWQQLGLLISMQSAWGGGSKQLLMPLCAMLPAN